MKTCVAILIALGASRTASADPTLPRVMTAPTAWLLPDGATYGTAGMDHRGDGSVDIGYGLGSVAELDVGADSDARECDAPPCAVMGLNHLPQTVLLARAGFRLGVPHDLLFKRLHAGVAAMDARHGMVRMEAKLRPLAGIELTPPQYPKTSLMVDLAWTPQFRPDVPVDAMTKGGPIPEWALGWGVRYQALSWSSIEVDVRHRGHGNEAEGLGATTVLLRVNAVWELSTHPR